jgi:hypothetical protein
MTRDPARIARICALLRAYWTTHPDLRLGQIVGNFTPTARTSVGGAEPGDPYYIEDEVYERALQQAGKRVEG